MCQKRCENEGQATPCQDVCFPGCGVSSYCYFSVDMCKGSETRVVQHMGSCHDSGNTGLH